VAKAIFQTRAGLTVGLAALGERRGVASVRQEVHDGDTLNNRAAGNSGRAPFLGADAPELSSNSPGSDSFASSCARRLGLLR
jgi:hypothetical protein